MIYTTIKLTSCLLMLLIVLTGCPMEEQTPRPNGEPSATPPATDADQPREPITTETPQRNGFQNGVEQQIRRQMQNDPQLSGQNVQIQERNGRITLSGTVESQQQSQRIEQFAEQVAGPGNVDNQLRVEQTQQQPQ